MVPKLHEAFLEGKSWVQGGTLLEAADSGSAYPGDVMKSQKNWRRLIETNGRGRYRLRLVKANQAGRKAFRVALLGAATAFHSHWLH